MHLASRSSKLESIALKVQEHLLQSLLISRNDIRGVEIEEGTMKFNAKWICLVILNQHNLIYWFPDINWANFFSELIIVYLRQRKHIIYVEVKQLCRCKLNLWAFTQLLYDFLHLLFHLLHRSYISSLNDWIECVDSFLNLEVLTMNRIIWIPHFVWDTSVWHLQQVLLSGKLLISNLGWDIQDLENRIVFIVG